ncbi:MAG TPA: GNAT family N-acetyltransferase [Terracidiphilus sp.]|jgi:CelD/BcsL family acetyltransferase involved in cellulose biosynthesis
MPLYTLDPMLDSRWDDLVASHPRSSVFHHKGWLKALAGTYGYRPLVLTRTPPGERLSDGIVFCEVKSWITGSRLVSLPFADHSEPLLNESDASFDLTEWMRTECRQHKWKYVELRPIYWEMHSDCPLVASQSFWLHTLNLAPSLDQIFRNLNKNCVQRRIRRAEREQLSYERGCSEGLLNDFYRLLMITRRRHRLLPQPWAWFRNLVACMSPSVEIRLARKGSNPIAAILTLNHRGTVVYKYGCSDEKFHHLAGMPFLFWKLIEEAKTAGSGQIDFGRTDLENDGLIRFKDQFGTTRKRLTYFRYSQKPTEKYKAVSDMPAARRLFSVLPDALASSAGRLLYRHIG